MEPECGMSILFSLTEGEGRLSNRKWIVSKPWSPRFWSRVLYQLPGVSYRNRTCVICHSPTEQIGRNTISRIRRCSSCGHAFAEKEASDFLVKWVYRGMDYWRIDKWYSQSSDDWEGCIDSRLAILDQVGLHCGPPAQRVFELGCSEGSILRALEDCGHEVVGCEINSEIAAYGSKTYGVTIRAGMFEDLDFPSSDFDIAYSFHTLEHLRDPHKIIGKISGMLQPDGTLLVEVPCNDLEYDNLDHLHFFTEVSLERLLNRYFSGVELRHNRYKHHSGTMQEALFGIGRRPA
jgi:SAM-dependent methyltransferase